MPGKWVSVFCARTSVQYLSGHKVRDHHKDYQSVFDLYLTQNVVVSL